MAEQKPFIIITGCSGRIGTKVAAKLCQEYPIVGLDIVPPKELQMGMTFFKADLSSDENISRCLEEIQKKYGNRIASVIHLAAYYSFSGENPELYDKITVQGTKRLLKGVRQFDTEQFLFSSTELVYAPSEKPINEDSPLDPKWDYPLSKVRTEKIMRDEHGPIPIVIMRIAGCYDDECHSIPIANQIQRIYEHQLTSHLFTGDIHHGSPFVHLDDMAEAIALAVQKRHVLPKELIVLISEDTTMSYDELQTEIAKLIDGKPFKTLIVPKWFAKGGAWLLNHTPGIKNVFIKPWMIDIADDNYILDVSRAHKILGWKPKHSIRDTLPKMIQFLKKDPMAFYCTNGLTLPSWLKNHAKS